MWSTSCPVEAGRIPAPARRQAALGICVNAPMCQACEMRAGEMQGRAGSEAGDKDRACQVVETMKFAYYNYSPSAGR